MPERALVEQLDRAIESALAGVQPAAAGSPALQELIEIANLLCDLPSEDFRKRLKTELQGAHRRESVVREEERKTTMTTPSTPEVRAGFRTLAPFIIHEKAPELVEFLKATFAAEELKRSVDEKSYGFYSEVRVGDSVIMIGGGSAASRGNLPGAFHVFVKDCDAAYRRAVEAGGVTLAGDIGKPADRPYGERSAFVRDAFGNTWYIATRLASPAPAQEIGTVMPYAHPARARKYIDFLGRAFGAEELQVVEQAGRVMHAAVRIGDAVLEMGESEERTLGGFFLFVEDVEASYQRALAAGATSIRPPEDVPYGLRSAIVRDPEGHLWWPARWTS